MRPCSTASDGCRARIPPPAGAADIAEVARGYASLVDRDRRAAFLATMRSVIGIGGQSVDASDRHYLSEGFPVLIIWAARDPIIP